jgi:L1 cell adhesion molecule like protein
MNSLDDDPLSELIEDNFWLQSNEDLRDTLHAVARIVVDKMVDLSLTFRDNQDIPAPTKEYILEYASEVISLGLLYDNYRDAIKEGDGERVLLCWKYMLLLFKATNRHNYAIEAFHTLADVKLLPPRLSHQRIWSRFVNTHGNGIPGHNKPCDLHMEHLNRLCKDCVYHLGANMTEKVICDYSKCIGPVFKIMSTFDEKHGLRASSGAHTISSSKKNQDLIMQELLKANIYATSPGRTYPSFPKFECNPTRTLKYSDILTWLTALAEAKGTTLIV